MILYNPPVLSGSIVNISDGTAGIFETLRNMRAIVDQSKKHPEVRSAAVNITLYCPQKGYLAEINALFLFCRDNIRYVQDVTDTETLTFPEFTLKTRAGDCDDKVMLLAAMLESIGHPTRFIVVGYSAPNTFEHVYLDAMLKDGRFVSLDPTERVPLGWAPPDPLAYFAEGVS